ncbi:hypothetical protein ACFQH2_15655 [Natronoarchaeum sp. GCM10025703]|uniref:hypothetical protein n=1 Tax=unclassified Natronoarchaeum TaxID=2620183 RepID=UPI00361591DE
MSDLKIKLETLWIRVRTILQVVVLLCCIGVVVFGVSLIALGLQHEAAVELTIFGIEFTPSKVGDTMLDADDQVVLLGATVSVIFTGIVARMTSGLGSQSF